jgi:hypothetical protein
LRIEAELNSLSVKNACPQARIAQKLFCARVIAIQLCVLLLETNNVAVDGLEAEEMFFEA